MEDVNSTFETVDGEVEDLTIWQKISNWMESKKDWILASIPILVAVLRLIGAGKDSGSKKDIQITSNDPAEWMSNHQYKKYLQRKKKGNKVLGDL